MESNIINKYKLLILSIVKNVDPEIKSTGRPIIHDYNKCIKIIFMIAKMGLSWSKISEINNINTDAVRKRYYKWAKLNVFYTAYNVLLKIYKNKYDLSNLFIDSTVIGNANGSLKYGFNNKIKNKKSIKISVIVDINRIPYILKVTPSNPHDSKIMEEIIEENNFNKPINLIGDKGYIKSNEYKQYISDTYNINLITPLRKNARDKTISENDKRLLHDRFVVENFFSLLKRRFLRISIINDKKINTYNNYLYLATGLMIQKYVMNN